MKEIQLLNNVEDGCVIDKELGAYRVVKNGADDIVILKHYTYKELRQLDVVSLNEGSDGYSVVEVKNYNTHIVKPFETLEGLSRKLCVDEEEIKKINNLNSNKLFIGQILKF